ncbi:hypothetical protein LZ480_06525 [Solibacillus sp. MA9]|uniref:CbiN domain protein n=1 Tax=Solibacillus palustris TaxID=2908203 RepID=A0ABS9UB30_9BACL|nr:hypothetical protein [Solibacillus sp. MA9]MCH7321545.1 hypothetical protein [Solibacillus sp. MA9]
MRLLLLIVISTLSLHIFFPNQTKALSCAELKEPIIDNYDMAVVGTVLNVKNDIVQKGFTWTKETKKYVLLQVEKSWKSEVASQIIFEADFTWGYNFEKNKKYYVYLHENNENYYNSPCSPVMAVNSSDDYPNITEKPFTPNEEVNLSSKMWFKYDKDLDLVFLLFGIAALCFFVWKRRANKK